MFAMYIFIQSLIHNGQRTMFHLQTPIIRQLRHEDWSHYKFYQGQSFVIFLLYINVT